MNSYYKKIKSGTDRFIRAKKKLSCYIHRYSDNEQICWTMDCLAHQYADGTIRRLDMLDTQANISVSRILDGEV